VDTPRRPLILVIAALCLAGAILIAVLVSRDTATVPSDLANSKPKHHHPQRPPGVKACHKGSQGHTIPAQIEGKVLRGDITTAIIYIHNGWVAGDCRGRTFVYAGSAGWKGSMGLAIISRFGHGSRQLGGGFIAVPDSGPLKITRAPQGPGLVTSAQRLGDIQFTSTRGVAGTIHLRDATATLSTGEVIRAVGKVRNLDPPG
jgi:hypothetical protein